jgi:hypothetical protein
MMEVIAICKIFRNPPAGGSIEMTHKELYISNIPIIGGRICILEDLR